MTQTRTEHELAAFNYGMHIDMEFAVACHRVGIQVKEAITAPLLMLSEAQAEPPAEAEKAHA